MYRQWRLYLLLLLAAVLFHLFYWDYIAFAALLLTAALPLLSFLITLAVSARVGVRLSCPAPVLPRGGTSALELTVENRSFLPVAWAKVQFSLQNRYSRKVLREAVMVPIGGRNITRLELPVSSEHCGSVVVTVDRLRLYGLLGLGGVRKRPGLSAELTFLPISREIENPAEIPLSESPESSRFSPMKSGEDSSQIFDYHEYRPGDPLKRVQWKLSARLDRLMVKDYALPLSGVVRIAVELSGAALTQLDLLLDACASISAWLLAGGIAHELVWYSQENAGLDRQLLSRDGDFDQALFSLYRLSRQGPSRLLEELVLSGGLSGCTELIYLTPSLPGEAADQLRILREKAAVHVVCASGKRQAFQALLQSLGEDGIPIALLTEETAGEVLRNFSF